MDKIIEDRGHIKRHSLTNVIEYLTNLHDQDTKNIEKIGKLQAKDFLYLINLFISLWN